MPDCADCSTPVSGRLEYSVWRGEYATICESCYDSGHRCAECGWHHEDRWNLSECDDCGDYFCDSGCYDDHVEIHEDNRGLNDWNYRPSFKFRGDDPNNLYFGVEMEFEVESISTGLELINEHDKHSLLYAKEDGSIGHGFELVTHPMTLGWMMENFPPDLLSQLKQRADASVHDGVGVHVHVDRRAVPDVAHRFRWIALMIRNREAMWQIANRGSTSYAEWPARYIPRMVGNSVAQERGDNGRYSAFNFQNSETIEFRAFRSTLKIEELRTYVQLLHAAIEYTRDLTVEDSDALSWSRFIAYVAVNEDTYPDLTSAIINRTLDSPEWNKMGELSSESGQKVEIDLANGRRPEPLPEPESPTYPPLRRVTQPTVCPCALCSQYAPAGGDFDFRF